MRSSKLLVLLLPVVAIEAMPVAGQEAPPIEARVWLDRGEEPVLQRGDMVRVYYRTSQDAYAAIFRIDTDGLISMVFPQHPGVVAPVQGGRDYRLILPNGTLWLVDEDPGAGYFFIVASPEPLDFSSFRYDQRRGWDLGSVGGVVYEDPYVAIDDYVAELVPDWEVVPYALDFLTYHVGNTFSYPRFLCYDCHDAQRYASWNPYDAVCTSVRVVIWDDPYFYPAYRYSGTNVVVARPARALPRYELVTRRAGDFGVRPLVYSRPGPERRVAQFKEAPPVPASSRVPVRRRTSPTSAEVPRQPASTPGSAQPARAGSAARSAARSSARPTADAPGGMASAPVRPRATAARAGPREEESGQRSASRAERGASSAPRPSAPVSRGAPPSRSSSPSASRGSTPARATKGSPEPATTRSTGRPAGRATARPATRPSAPSPSDRAATDRGTTPSAGSERRAPRPAASGPGRAAPGATSTSRGAATRPVARPRAAARGN